LAAVAAGAVLLNRELVARERKPAAPAGGTLVGDLHVVDEGEGDPVVLLHGFAGSLRWFDALAPLLAADRRVIRIDLLGHGGSAKPATGYEIDAQARRVGETLDALGVEHALFVGHSMGGAVSVALAQQRPGLFSGLVVLDEGPDNSFGHTPLLAKLGFVPVIGELIHRVAADPMIADGYDDAFGPGFDHAAHVDVVKDFRAMTYTSYKQAYVCEDAFLRQQRLDARLHEAGIPALVVFGEEDRFFRADDCAAAFRALPNARVEVIPGAGHSPNVETPERVAELIASAA